MQPRKGHICWCAVLLLTICASTAAQTVPAEGGFEVSGGGGLFGGSSFGSRDANLRGSDAQASPFRLFSTDTKLGNAPFIEARVGYRMTTRIGVEGRFTFSRPEIRTSIGNDVEGAPSRVAIERLDQYVVDLGVVLKLDGLRIAGVTPFVAGGAGYVRQLHEGLTLIEEGADYYAGGGIERRLVTRPRAKLDTIGVRVDATLHVIAGGVSFDSVSPRGSLSGTVFVGF